MKINSRLGCPVDDRGQRIFESSPSGVRTFSSVDDILRLISQRWNKACLESGKCDGTTWSVEVLKEFFETASAESARKSLNGTARALGVTVDQLAEYLLSCPWNDIVSDKSESEALLEQVTAAAASCGLSIEDLLEQLEAASKAEEEEEVAEEEAVQQLAQDSFVPQFFAEEAVAKEEEEAPEKIQLPQF